MIHGAATTPISSNSPKPATPFSTTSTVFNSFQLLLSIIPSIFALKVTKYNQLKRLNSINPPGKKLLMTLSQFLKYFVQAHTQTWRDGKNNKKKNCCKNAPCNYTFQCLFTFKIPNKLVSHM